MEMNFGFKGYYTVSKTASYQEKEKYLHADIVELRNWSRSWRDGSEAKHSPCKYGQELGSQVTVTALP